MKFLALEREQPGLSAEDFAPYGEAEARRAWALMTAGIFREIYFNPDEHTAIIILETEDKATAQDALNSCRWYKRG